MPIYEYICVDCGEAFEALVANSRSKSSCPKCGSKKLSRQFSTFAAHGQSAAPSCAQKGCPMSGGCPSGGMCPGSH
jgi:putative FmdB family regulatory protein